MAISEEKSTIKYLYYDYHNGHIAREEYGNDKCVANAFDCYIDGEWINDYTLSLHLSDAIRNCCGYTFSDYEEITEEEAMRRIAEIDRK